MNREEALHALGLDINVTPAEIENALLDRVAQLEQRMTTAPTDALKQKYRDQLAQLEIARAALSEMPAAGGLSQTMLADLPLAQAAYTRAQTGSRPAGGISIKIGQVLANRYQIKEQIGVGGMGTVFSAFDRNRDKDIAIKVLSPQMLTSPKARERFLNEARLSSEMSHPNIVTVFDVQQDGPYSFLTMELLRGQSLRVYLNSLHQLRRPMSVDEALKIVDQVCRALAYAHERTVHRDIKPENIWLTDDGKAKIMDFGIARLVTTTQMTQTMMSMGTAYYMAPEQLAGRADIDGRADQYSTAVLLYEMLSGGVPTGRIDPLKKVRKDVSSALSIAVDRALSSRPDERYPSVEAFRAALYRSPLLHSKTPLLIGVGAIGVVVLAVVLTAFAPSLKSLLPDREAEAAAKQEVARLQGEVKAMQKLLDTQRREVKDGAQNAAREVEKFEGQMRSARTAEEKLTAQTNAIEAKDKALVAALVDQRFKLEVEGKDGLAALEGRISAADNLAKSNQAVEAARQYREILAELQRLKTIPDLARQQAAEQQAKLMQMLEGKWSLADCEKAASWIVRGNSLQVLWPEMGLVEERILQAGDGQIYTSVVSPAKYRGSLYRYQPAAKRIEATDLRSQRTEALIRCE